jgi:hypothetical protein
MLDRAQQESAFSPARCGHPRPSAQVTAAECLNFAAKIHHMPRYPWQCLNFPGTRHRGADVSRDRGPERVRRVPRVSPPRPCSPVATDRAPRAAAPIIVCQQVPMAASTASSNQVASLRVPSRCRRRRARQVLLPSRRRYRPRACPWTCTWMPIRAHSRPIWGKPCTGSSRRR